MPHLIKNLLVKTAGFRERGRTDLTATSVTVTFGEERSAAKYEARVQEHLGLEGVLHGFSTDEIQVTAGDLPGHDRLVWLLRWRTSWPRGVLLLPR